MFINATRSRPYLVRSRRLPTHRPDQSFAATLARAWQRQDHRRAGSDGTLELFTWSTATRQAEQTVTERQQKFLRAARRLPIDPRLGPVGELEHDRRRAPARQAPAQSLQSAELRTLDIQFHDIDPLNGQLIENRVQRALRQ